jgi:Xaa-Pro aminopeptidase
MRRTTLFCALLSGLVSGWRATPSAAEPHGAGHDAAAADVPAELPMEVYAQRRERLMQRIGNCVAAIRSVRKDDQVDPNFFYLTGLDDDEAVLVLAPNEPIFRQTLALRPRDPEAEIWEGYREPMSAKLRLKYRVDAVGRTRQITRSLRRALRRSHCYAHLTAAYEDKPAVAAATLGDLLTAYEARAVQKWQVLEHMRAVKEPEEIARMERAITITAMGHRAAVLAMAKGVAERIVMGAIEKAFYDTGATGMAFPSIVGSGENGAVLHWVRNDRVITGDELVVVDIGAAYGGYAADVTRTWPVSGKFSAEQRRIYEIVLAAQEQAIAAVRPGISLDELHRIGEQAILDAGYDLPHYIGHFVGLEVHDVGDTAAPLEPGMVITIEPGIYLQGELGVRIEDEVLVTDRGHRLLTAALPRTVADVEAWIARQRGP